MSKIFSGAFFDSLFNSSSKTARPSQKITASSLGTDKQELIDTITNALQQVNIVVKDINPCEGGYKLTINKKNSTESKDVFLKNENGKINLSEFTTKYKLSSRLNDINKSNLIKESLFDQIELHFTDPQSSLSGYQNPVSIKKLQPITDSAVDTTHKALIDTFIEKNSQNTHLKKEDAIDTLNTYFKQYNMTITDIKESTNGFTLTVNTLNKNETKTFNLISINNTVTLRPNKVSKFKSSRADTFNNQDTLIKNKFFSDVQSIHNTFRKEAAFTIEDIDLVDYFGPPYTTGTLRYNIDNSLTLSVNTESYQNYDITYHHDSQSITKPQKEISDSVITNCIVNSFDSYNKKDLDSSRKDLTTSYIGKAFSKDTHFFKQLNAELSSELGNETLESVSHNKKTGHIKLTIKDTNGKLRIIEFTEKKSWIGKNKFVVKGKFNGAVKTKKLLGLYNTINEKKVTNYTTPRRSWGDYFKDKLWFKLVQSTSESHAKKTLITSNLALKEELKYLHGMCGSKYKETNFDLYSSIQKDCADDLSKIDKLDSKASLADLVQTNSTLKSNIKLNFSDCAACKKDEDETTFKRLKPEIKKLKDNRETFYTKIIENKVYIAIETLDYFDVDPESINSQFIQEQLASCTQTFLTPVFSTADQHLISQNILQARIDSFNRLTTMKTQLEDNPSLDLDPLKTDLKADLSLFYSNIEDLDLLLDDISNENLLNTLNEILALHNNLGDQSIDFDEENSDLLTTLKNHTDTLGTYVSLMTSYYDSDASIIKLPHIKTFITMFDDIKNLMNNSAISLSDTCARLNSLEEFILDNFEDISNVFHSSLFYECQHKETIHDTHLFKPYLTSCEELIDELNHYSQHVLATIDALRQYKTQTKPYLFENLDNYSDTDITDVANEIIDDISKTVAFNSCLKGFEESSEQEKVFLSTIDIETGLNKTNLTDKKSTSFLGPREGYTKFSIANTDFFLKERPIKYSEKNGKLIAGSDIAKKDGKTVFYHDSKSPYVWVKLKDNSFKFIDHTTVDDPEGDQFLKEAFPDIFNHLSKSTFLNLVNDYKNLQDVKNSEDYQQLYKTSKETIEQETHLNSYKDFMKENPPLTTSYLEKKYPRAMFSRNL